MLVYGDRSEIVRPRERLAALGAALREGACTVRSAGRDAFAGALIDAGALAQGLADLEFQAAGMDLVTPMQTASMQLTLAVARLAVAAPRPGRSGGAAEASDALSALAQLDLPDAVGCRTPEGYAFYAVYPQAYAAAAASQVWDQPPLVVGLRSIGTSLAAAVAAATGSPAPLTFRPTGEPFARTIRASRELKRILAAHRGAFLVADEGPGLSGSSFGAAADLLGSLGITEDRIVLMPSHAGEPGNEASSEARARWRRAPRLVRTLDDLLQESSVADWFEDITGPVGDIRDLSAGAWRRDLPARSWPPSWPQQERRKFQLSAATGTYAARFAGLGRIGDEKLARARALHAGGFVPEPLAVRRGFLLERWIDGPPLEISTEQRPAFLEHLSRYLATRARLTADRGADAGTLVEMAVVNAGDAGGSGLREAVARRMHGERRWLEGGTAVAIDARLHAWEWRRDRQGRIWKTDALDHCCAHDLIGCQDIAWDVAGAIVEFDLCSEEAGRLAAAVGAPPEQVGVMELAYCAFQTGLWWYAAQDPAEAERAGDLASRYLDRLRLLVGRS